MSWIGRGVLQCAVLAVISSFLAVTSVRAQSCTTTSTPTGPCNLTFNSFTTTDRFVVSLSATNTALTPPRNANQYTNGTTTTGPTITVKANRSWHVSMVGHTATFGFINTGGNSFANPNKPASDFKWGTLNGTYPNNAGVAATLSSGTATNGASQQIFFQTAWSFTRDVPGTYSLQLDFTFSAP